MSKKILILGACGMLGSAVYNVLKEKYSLVLTTRNKEEISLLESHYSATNEHQSEELDVDFIYQDYLVKKGGPGPYFNSFLDKIGEVDYVVNCIGVTIPFSLNDPLKTFFINSAFPFILEQVFGSRLIHVTTDCVFNGKEGFPYNENSLKMPVDIYGISKSLGEPTRCLTIRTSLIGRELTGFTGFLEWFLQQEGKTINGFKEHFWNGITARQFGKICDKIFQNPDKFYRTGIFHVFSNTVSKYDMLLKAQKKYKVNCIIVPDETNKLNRTLSTIHPLCSQLEVPSFDEMIDDI
ncbi:MAG: sugar nucleotide-binding protein [Candidatus Pacebacteria bacterium]|nr:sugar nucleotide-binding protein [Candidatus Paceibacterota bacterium]